jgi:ComF family protein
MKILDNLLGWLAPHDCLGCGAEGSLLCAGCEAGLPAARSAKVRAVTPYKGIAKELVWRLKFDSARAAAKIMARRMLPLLPDSGVLVPIPTTALRRRQRGYDQTVLIAQELSRLSGLQMKLWLARSGRQHQIGAARAQRRTQLQRAFRPTRQAKPAGKQIILVDDVVTTGATLAAAAAVLAASGAAKVVAVVFAQA